MAYRDIEVRRQRDRERFRKRTAERISQGLCPRCGDRAPAASRAWRHQRQPPLSPPPQGSPPRSGLPSAHHPAQRPRPNPSSLQEWSAPSPTAASPWNNPSQSFTGTSERESDLPRIRLLPRSINAPIQHPSRHRQPPHPITQSPSNPPVSCFSASSPIPSALLFSSLLFLSSLRSLILTKLILVQLACDPRLAAS